MGAPFGAIIVGTFSPGLRLLGVRPRWTFFVGVLIIVAVAADRWIRRAAA